MQKDFEQWLSMTIGKQKGTNWYHISLVETELNRVVLQVVFVKAHTQKKWAIFLGLSDS